MAVAGLVYRCEITRTAQRTYIYVQINGRQLTNRNELARFRGTEHPLKDWSRECPQLAGTTPDDLPKNPLTVTEMSSYWYSWKSRGPVERLIPQRITIRDLTY